MKRSILCFTLSLVCFLAGCGQAQADTQERMTEKPPTQTEFISSVKPEDCYVCGNRKNSLIPYYAKRDSIGVIHWNKPSVSDTEVRAYDDNGKELFEQEHSSMKWSSFGDGYGSVMVSGTPNRGFTNVTVNYTEKDKADFESIKELLCQSCLDKVACFYADQKEYGDDRIATTGYCLIDFTTRELYTLSDPYRGYFIRDYYVSYDICEGEDSRIELFIFYAPERKK